jgi:hypothetical protein
MEHRRELEDLLLAGLGPAEREHTVAKMIETNTKKFDHLRSRSDQLDDGEPPGE